MTTLTINRNQNLLLGEMISIMPQYDGKEVLEVLKEALKGIRQCKKAVNEEPVIKEEVLSSDVTSLIGIVPEFTDEELASDERLRQILSH